MVGATTLCFLQTITMSGQLNLRRWRGGFPISPRGKCALDLARRFRDIANVKSVTQQSDIEIVHLAERMVGKAPSPDKH